MRSKTRPGSMRALEDVGQQLVDVGADGRGAAADPDVLEEHRLRERDGLVVRHADAPDRAAGPRDRRPTVSVACSVPTHSSTRVDAEAAGELADALRRPPRRARRRRRWRRARAPASVRSAWRPMMMICSAPRRLAAITPHSPTAPSPTTATRVAGLDAGHDGGVVAGAEHVGERQQRRHQRVVLADRQREERAVGVAGRARPRPARALVAVAVEEAAVHARGVQALVAEGAGAVGERERHHDQVAALDGAHVGADVLDDADRLVAHRAGRSRSAPGRRTATGRCRRCRRG